MLGSAPGMALTRESLREYLSTKTRRDLSKVDDDAELFSSGLIDSFAMVDLLVFLEKSAGTKLGPEDINLDNLDSVNRILGFAAAHGKR